MTTRVAPRLRPLVDVMNGALWNSGPGDQLDVPLAQAHGPVLRVDQRPLVADDDLGPARAAPRGQRPAVGGQPGREGGVVEGRVGLEVDRQASELLGRRPPGLQTDHQDRPGQGQDGPQLGVGQTMGDWHGHRPELPGGQGGHIELDAVGRHDGHDVVHPDPEGGVGPGRAVGQAVQLVKADGDLVTDEGRSGGVAFSQPGHGVAQRHLHQVPLAPVGHRARRGRRPGPGRHHGRPAPSAANGRRPMGRPSWGARPGAATPGPGAPHPAGQYPPPQPSWSGAAFGLPQ